VTAVICVNALYIGYSTDYMAKHQTVNPPIGFDIMEMCFLTLFTLEITLRFIVFRMDLFRKKIGTRVNENVGWNIFDYLVIGLQLLERIMRAMPVNSKIFGSISVIRLLRLLRLVRIVRLIKVLRVVTDLRIIVMCIYRSLSLFLWSVIAIFLLIYITAIYFVQVTLDIKLDLKPEDIALNNAANDKWEIELNKRFGTLVNSMTALFKTITGGVDWGDITDELEYLKAWPYCEIMFYAYVAFATIAMLNVIAGVFLDKAMERAIQEREQLLLKSAKEVFEEADTDGSGKITLSDFKIALEHDDVQTFFTEIDLEVAEAADLFVLLDTDSSGSITGEEFFKGCLRLRGPAKALDLLKLDHKVQLRFEEQDAHIEKNVRANHEAIIANRHAYILNHRGLSKSRQSSDDRPASPPPQPPEAPVTLPGVVHDLRAN
jgi:hypothetical protein